MLTLGINYFFSLKITLWGENSKNGIRFKTANMLSFFNVSDRVSLFSQAGLVKSFCLHLSSAEISSMTHMASLENTF